MKLDFGNVVSESDENLLLRDQSSSGLPKSRTSSAAEKTFRSLTGKIIANPDHKDSIIKRGKQTWLRSKLSLLTFSKCIYLARNALAQSIVQYR